MQTTSGGVCPAGHYCVAGSSVPTPCPSGFYQNKTGGKSKDDCKPCPVGKQERFNTNLALLCTKFFILFGDSAIEDVLTVWTFLPGWFQESSGQTECVPCPPGFHCQSLSPSPLLCPAGYICPNKSLDSQPLPCPRGTYNPSQGLTTTGNNPES